MFIACDHQQMALSLLGHVECNTGIDFIVSSDGIISKNSICLLSAYIEIDSHMHQKLYHSYASWYEQKQLFILGEILTLFHCIFKAIIFAKRNLLQNIWNWDHSSEQVGCLVRWWGNETLKIILNKMSFYYVFPLILIFL